MLYQTNLCFSGDEMKPICVCLFEEDVENEPFCASKYSIIVFTLLRMLRFQLMTMEAIIFIKIGEIADAMRKPRLGKLMCSTLPNACFPVQIETSSVTCPFKTRPGPN